MNCSHCSANIPGDAITCPYCGTETPLAAKAREEQEQQARHAAQLAAVEAGKARAKALAALDSSAKTSFYASIFGVACCIPVGSVVGLVMAFRARKTAASLNAPAPWQSMAAIILGIFWIGFFSLAMVMGQIAAREKDARVAVLRAEVKDALNKPTLDAPAACRLAELALLEGWGPAKSDTGGSVAVFRCDGALEQTGTKAVLKDLEYARRSGSTEPVIEADACLSFRTKWKIDAIGTGPDCGAHAADAADAGSPADED